MAAIARFGSYEILHELKSGGMGAVLLARRRGPGTFEQLVAIKTIRAEYASAEAVRAMFLDEAAILARVAHPGIATVHDFGEDAGTLYLAMEYVAGISFRALAGRSQGFRPPAGEAARAPPDLDPPPGVVARAIAEACRGLHAAHEVRDTSGALLGVVHRDISPDNLMLGYDGHVKVIDFGIALVKNRQAPVTEFGTVKGKPPYMSPEQVKNEPLDRRSDVFSLGVVLHELLTGEPLFDGDSIYAVARAVAHQEIRPPSQVLGRSLPAGLDSAVMAALERDLARRTPTAAAFAEQLEQVIADAGDETLEAWAERSLAEPRDAHRAWLARVIAGRDAPPRPIGRATGAVTHAGPLAHLTSLPAPDEPGGPAPDDGDELVPARASRLPRVIAVLVLLALGAGVVYLTRPGVRAAPPDAALAQAPADASPDAASPEPGDAAAAEAPVDASVPVDARAPADAAVDTRVRRVVRHVARPADRPVDARAAPVTIDAAAVTVGSGTLIVKHHPRSSSYLEVYVDGRQVGKTPILAGKRLRAGTHAIRLVRPDTGAVVHERTITVEAGATVTVVQPTPH